MGVTGLLPCLQSITKHVSLEKYRGLTAAVDAMCWLHKGVFTGDVSALAKYQIQEMEIERNADETESSQQALNEDGGSFVKALSFDHCATVKKPRAVRHSHSPDCPDAKLAMSKCIDYVIRHSELIRKQYGIELILVIDGGSLPSKSCTNEKRRMDRNEAYKKGLEAEKRGDSRESRKQFSRACSISHEMRHLLVTQCKLRGIPFLVAPYEADAQLAKLAHCGIADVVISEDSDLLAYACPRVLFKINFKIGKGDEIQIMRDLASNDSLSFRNWSQDMFVYMCILAGCDYCEGIPGVGIKTAHKYVRMYRNPAKMFKSLRASGKMPDKFEDAFWIAYQTFRHQRVYCPQKRAIESLFPIQEKGDHNQMWEFLGPWIEPSMGISIAEGKMHPTKMISWDQVELLKKQLRCALSTGEFTSRGPQSTLAQEPTANYTRLQRKPDQNENSSSPVKDDVFAFFKVKKGASDDKKRPPLKEIHLNQNFALNQQSIKAARTDPHAYSSNLVATSFQPLSRNPCSNRLLQKRKGVSKAIRKLKNKLSLKKVLDKEHAKKIERSGLRRVQEPQRKAAESLKVDDVSASLNMASDGIFDKNSASNQRDLYDEISTFAYENSMQNIQHGQNVVGIDVCDGYSTLDGVSETCFDYEPPSVDGRAFEESLIDFTSTKQAKLDEGSSIFEDSNGETRTSESLYFEGVARIDSRQNSQFIDMSFESMGLDDVESRRSLHEVENNVPMSNAGSQIPYAEKSNSFDYCNFYEMDARDGIHIATTSVMRTVERHSYNIDRCHSDNFWEEDNDDVQTTRDFLENIDTFRHL
jgi:exonuclease-1